MSLDNTPLDLDRTLREQFGLEQFRPGQREVIEQVLGGRDVLCVMPTGGGKSLCYQLPAVRMKGVTLVVSPLIALMKDQVDALTGRGLRATLINSTLDPSEQHARLVEIELGRYDLVYVAPERFRSGRFVEAMGRVRPALLAVDEAHCISEWGHDFRPDYARLGQARKALGMPPVIALTATATDLVRRDIADQLDLRDPAQFVTGFDRPNLLYRVVAGRKDVDKLAAVAEALGRNPGPAIIYASSRKRCEEVGRHVERALGRPAVVYHAGLTRDERHNAQERFMSGEADVVVATNAFGMGVDKADIRAVIHFNMPGTIEAYYQEAGRAGRDGQPAECLLIHAHGDRVLQEMFIENEYPSAEAVFQVYNYLRGIDADPIELTQAEIKEAARVDLAEGGVGSALRLLEQAGALERFRPRENMAIVRINAEPDGPSLVERLAPQAHVQRVVMAAVEGLVGGRFGEPIYFHPDEFAAALGLDRTALARALKHLAAELPVDYVPPFRGNAVRILDRHRRPRDLGIDFGALRQRKRQEYDKLERMMKYAQTSKCRRAYILGYFGDAESSGCGRCDNCGDATGAGGTATTRVIDTPAGREVVLKALSGVARAKGRFGKTVVAQMLTGSDSEKMDRWGLRRLSTFGLLSDFRQAEVVQILDALTVAGLIECQDVDRFRPILILSEAGQTLMRSTTPTDVPLCLPDELAVKVRLGGLQRLAPRHSTTPTGSLAESDLEAVFGPARAGASPPEPVEGAEPSAKDDPLWAALRGLRTQLARESNLSPAYVFSNETLDLLVRQRPRTPHALAQVKGIGPAKLERFGAALLGAIAAFEPPVAGESVPSLPRQEVGPGSRRTSEPGGSQQGAPANGRPNATTTVPLSPANQREHGPLSTTDVAQPEPRDASAYVSTEEWTWRLLDRGFTLDEAAAIRGLEPAAIIRHATRMARLGKPVSLGAFLDPDLLDRWDAWRRDHGDAPPPDAASLWPLYLACRAQP